MSEEKDEEQGKRGIAALFTERCAALAGTVLSARFLVGLGASMAVTGSVAGPLAAQAISARNERPAEAAQESTTTLRRPTTTQAERAPESAVPTPAAAAPSPAAPATSPSPTTAPPASTTTPRSSTTSTSQPSTSTTSTPGSVVTPAPTAAQGTTPAATGSSGLSIGPAVPTTGAVVTTTSPPTTAAPVTPAGIMVATQAGRGDAQPINNTRVGGTLHVFFTDPGTISEVQFWLDGEPPGTPSRSDSTAPFDLAEPLLGDAPGLDTVTYIPDGIHELVVRAIIDGNIVERRATFEVRNGLIE